MFSQITLRRAFFAAVIGLFSIGVDAKDSKTKKLQILVDPEASSFVFSLNASDPSGLITDQFATRPTGSSYIMNGRILPGGTIDRDQITYLVDKHGHDITESDFIGTLWIMSNVISTVDFEDLTPGTLSEIGTWNFLFKKNCDGDPNVLNATGTTTVKDNSLDQTSFESVMNVFAGTGCNKNEAGNNFKAKVYYDENDVQLIEIEFDKDIEYKK